MAAAPLHGIWGHPYLDLDGHLDLSELAAIDDEIMFGLPQVDTSYTGGSLKQMGVVSPSAWTAPYADYGLVIAGFSREEFERFVSLGDEPSQFDLERYREYRFGDETDHPLTWEQMLYLKYRYGVYFPWKVCFHFLHNDRWEDKNSGTGKEF